MKMCRPEHAASKSLGYPHRTLQNWHQRRFSARSARRLTSHSAATVQYAPQSILLLNRLRGDAQYVQILHILNRLLNRLRGDARAWPGAATPRLFSSVVSDRILGCLFVDGTVDRRYRRLLHCDLLPISYLNKTNSYTKIGLLMNRRR